MVHLQNAHLGLVVRSVDVHIDREEMLMVRVNGLPIHSEGIPSLLIAIADDNKSFTLGFTLDLVRSNLFQQ